jgi:hypothetical protein
LKVRRVAGVGHIDRGVSDRSTKEYVSKRPTAVLDQHAAIACGKFEMRALKRGHLLYYTQKLGKDGVDKFT